MPYETPLTDAELTDALERLPEWTRDGATLTRTAKVADFRTAVQLVNAVADAAEAANHHPDVCIHDYKRVTFTLSTHAAGAITRRDTDLAAEIDQLVP
ncbi:MAG: 4a-hydroxytetrahydrobiopterin dehydratase [Candidatus Limnocylindria bacterium]